VPRWAAQERDDVHNLSSDREREIVVDFRRAAFMTSAMQAPKVSPSTAALALGTHEDEDLASGSTARLLITAVASEDAEACARRVHGLSARWQRPFVCAQAADLPGEVDSLRDACAHLLNEAAGGTLFVNDIEAMSPDVQEVFLELLDDLHASGSAAAAVRLVSGTTVPLLDRVAAGAFAEWLFYRLNVIHLTPTNHRAAEPV
jgi:transcriptional regulator of aromatic amino acid metabolism